MRSKLPNSRRNLDVALERLVGKASLIAKRTVVANAIVAQLLPDGAVKGGSAIKIRLGDSATRFATDLDIARASSLDEFSERLSSALGAGWEGFTGTLVEERQAHPKGVPPQYVMQPFAVKLSYNGKPWLTVKLEVGHDEIGDADDSDLIMPADANAILEDLGFPPIGPVPVMPLRHQIAQKLHAVSTPDSMRAHDLIDLQLLDMAYGGGYSDVRATCLRLFSYSTPPKKKELHRRESASVQLEGVVQGRPNQQAEYDRIDNPRHGIDPARDLAGDPPDDGREDEGGGGKLQCELLS